MKLDLSRKRLKVLPPGIELAGVTELWLCDNQFTSIPEPVFSMTQLRVLNLAHNSISVLPHELTRLTNLESLTLYLCPVTQVPDWMAGFEKLEFLWLSNHEGLTYITPRLGELPLLKSLLIDSEYTGNDLGKFLKEAERVIGRMSPTTLRESTLRYVCDPRAGVEDLEAKEFGYVGGRAIFRDRIVKAFSRPEQKECLQGLGASAERFVEANDYFADRAYEAGHEAELKEQLPARRQDLVGLLERMRPELEAAFPEIVGPACYDDEGRFRPGCLELPGKVAHRLWRESIKALRELETGMDDRR